MIIIYRIRKYIFSSLKNINLTQFTDFWPSSGGGAESSTVTRVRSVWEKFRELLPLLTTKAIFVEVKGELYAAYVCSVMLYCSETWPIKVEESQRLHRNEMSMIWWMCGITMRDRYPCEELRARVGIKPIADVMRQRRLCWFGHNERREITAG